MAFGSVVHGATPSSFFLSWVNGWVICQAVPSPLPPKDETPVNGGRETNSGNLASPVMLVSVGVDCKVGLGISQ